MSLNDTAKEGDTGRLLVNSKYNIPFFYAHSALSKYAIENVDFVIKSQYLLSTILVLPVPLQLFVVLLTK